MSERYPRWFVIALFAEIVVARFFMSGWAIWSVCGALFLFVAVIFGRVVNVPWLRESVRAGVETTVADAATWSEVARRRYAWVKNVTFSMALFVVFLAIAFDAVAKF